MNEDEDDDEEESVVTSDGKDNGESEESFGGRGRMPGSRTRT